MKNTDMTEINTYPTKEEILATKPEFKEGIILLIKTWKSSIIKDWKKKELLDKITNLAFLIQALCISHDKNPPKIILRDEYACDIKKKKIYLDVDNPSIISTLHETAHYLFGKDELIACQWSIWLFKECFPKSFEKLEFKGHLLIKK
jgi:hypothetical protein